MEKPNSKQLKQALMNLENDKDFLLFVESLNYERNLVIEALAGVQPSDILQGLSGQLRARTLIIEDIKEKQKR